MTCSRSLRNSVTKQRPIQHHSDSIWNIRLPCLQYKSSRNESALRKSLFWPLAYRRVPGHSTFRDIFWLKSFSITSPESLCIADTSLPSVEVLIDTAGLWLLLQNPHDKLAFERISGLAAWEDNVNTHSLFLLHLDPSNSGESEQKTETNGIMKIKKHHTFFSSWNSLCSALLNVGPYSAHVCISTRWPV